MKVALRWSLLASSWGLALTLSNMTITSTHTRRQHLRGINVASAMTFHDSPDLTWGDPDRKQDHRNLQDMHSNHNDFVPLSCNQPACKEGTALWSNQRYRPEVRTVVIPCGLCVTMDFDDSETLILPLGLDIQGTLIFPDGYRITIETPFVRVQGVLEMIATNSVTDEPSVRILLTGADTSLTSFVPAGENELACSAMGATTASPCNVGNKPIVVAGGRLNIRGLPESCKTWVKLEDLVAQTSLPSPAIYTTLPEPTPNHLNPLCRSLGPYMVESFDTDANVYGWTSGYGGKYKVTPNGFFRVTDRVSAEEHGPTWDLLNVRDCLIPGQTYLFSARIRLSKPSEETGTPTSCAVNESCCLILQSTTRFESRQEGSRKGFEKQSDHFVYGEWETFYSAFTFTADELDQAAIYHIFQLEGPDPDVVIEMDDITFSLPSQELVPEPSNVCAGNLIMNGNADYSIHPYPMETFVGGRLTVETMGNGNNFFRTGFRTNDMDSVSYSLAAPGCMGVGARYKVSARLRIQSNKDVKSEMNLRIFFRGGSSSRFLLAECPPSWRKWVVCESVFEMLEEFDSDQVESIRLSFETFGGPTDNLDIDDWELVFLEGPKTSILVAEDGVAGCWDDGAEILITSHTLDFEAQQVRRLVGTTSVGDGLVRLDVDEFIIPPVTRRDSEDFAVEVALLSRNFVFEGATDESDSLLGGHLIVLHTPHVMQTLEGVELKNFGRQGEIGRYPIHFHLSGNVDGALVSKNTIRASNQRCVVIHGTHNVTISDNVAFDTKGHCYMTEDGGEIDNAFVRNLGALTRAATRLVRPGETDINNPSTFWCSNPVNEWVGNVAAGCESNGFWFELQETVRSPTSEMPLSAGMNPRRSPLKLFRDNVCHSNQIHGLRTYPGGFLPSKQAIFENTRSYKNRGDGIFFHNSENLSITGGVLADNKIQADFDRADNIVIDGTVVIGVTSLYQEIVDTQIGTPFHDDTVVGIELHGFVRDPSLQGATIRNVRFSGFSGSRSNHTALIQFDSEKWSGNFDYWTTVEGVQIDDDNISPLHFYFLKAALNGVRNVYLTDLDSGMKPKGSSASGISSVVSDSPEMTTFLETSRCVSFPNRGFLYCSDTCLRTVTFATSPAETETFVLRLSARSDPNLFFDYPGRYFYESDDDGELDEMSNTEIRKFRYFSASIPSGDYVASFLDSKLEESWPTFVETTVESPQCLGSLPVDGVELHIPDVRRAQCSELIRNGDMELSTTSYPHWLHFGIGVNILPGEGIDGSNAIASNPDQNRESGYIGQYLDVRCLEEGTTYEVQAWVRLERDGIAFACSGSNCPLVRLRSRAPSDESGQAFSETLTTVATEFVRPLNEKGWNLLQSTFTIDSPLASATSVSLVIERGVNNVQMLLDDVKVTRVEKDCAELVFNGDFSEGTSAYWEKDGGDLEMLSIQGNPALRMVSRSSDANSMVQNIQTRCMMKGERYSATAKMRLIESDGTPSECDTTERSGGNACPNMRLRSFVDIGLPTLDADEGHYGGSIAKTDHGVTTDGWYIMSGVFEATDYDQRGGKSVLYFPGAWRGKDLVIDDVSISPLSMDCTELILNGDAEYGETPSFWTHYTGVAGTTIEVVNVGSGSNVFKVSNRPIVGEGMSQTVDSRCLHQGSKWKLTARMKLVSRSSGDPVGCDPSDDRVDFACPPILVAGYQSREKVVDERYYTSRSSWVADAFNDYEVEFAVSDALAASDVVEIAIRTYNLDWEVLVDDISVTPVF